MVLPTIKEIVKDNQVYFVYYRNQTFYYDVTLTDGRSFLFPVPDEEIRNECTLYANDKALYFMRYIRKAMEEEKFVERL